MYRRLLVLFICLAGIGQQCYAKSHIKITVKQMQDREIILANYYNGKVYAIDTARLNSKGIGYFKNKDLPGGLYMLIFSPNNYFELIIGKDQDFSIHADTLKTMDTFRIDGSAENQAFLELQKFTLAQTKLLIKLQETYKQEPNKADKNIQEKYNQQIKQLDNEKREFTLKLIKQNPGTALATFANSTLSLKVPDFSKEVPQGIEDREHEIQRRTFFYEKAHYWDNTDLNDSVLIRTPIFKEKLDKYFNNMLFVHPDSLYRGCVDVIERAKDCPEMFRYLVNYCFKSTQDNKIMGMDEAFVKLCKTYFLSGRVTWIDKGTMKKIDEGVMRLEYNLIGHKALDLRLPTIDGNQVSLLETKAPFTVLLFWEYSCGHCKYEVPAIKTEIYNKFKDYGLKVFAVHTKNDKAGWEKFVSEHNLFDFINCWDPQRQSNYWTIYNVPYTPVFYLLDKDKTIIAKKLSVEQIVDLLKREYKKQGVEII